MNEKLRIMNYPQSGLTNTDVQQIANLCYARDKIVPSTIKSYGLSGPTFPG